MRTKKTETWLLNIANHLIGQAQISHHVLCLHDTPSRFFHLINSEVGPKVWDKMLPGTLGDIGYFALGSIDKKSSAMRQITFKDVWAGDLVADKNCGPHLLFMTAMIVIAGVMYELLATERIVRFGPEVAKVNYEPTHLMIEFVKQTRIWDIK